MNLSPISFAAAALVLALAACKPAEPPTYWLSNSTGQRITAAMVSDAAGELAATREEIGDDDTHKLDAHFRVREGDTVTVQWLGGAGRARWYEAVIPFKTRRGSLSIAVGPGLRACAYQDAGGASSDPAAAPRSCVDATELPRLVPGMAATLRRVAETRPAPFFSEHAGSPRTEHRLASSKGNVGIFGKEAFLSAIPLGKHPAWIVDAWIGGEAGMFLVSPEGSGWKTRYLGRLDRIGDELFGTMILLDGPQGYRIAADTASAAIFVLPGTPNRDYWLLGQGQDGAQVAVAISDQASEGPAGRAYHLRVLELENGTFGNDKPAALPALPDGEAIETYYRKWYRDHCTWTPALACRGTDAS